MIFCNGMACCTSKTSSCTSLTISKPVKSWQWKSSSYMSVKAPQQLVRKETKRKDCAFWRQFNEKPSTIPGCPGQQLVTLLVND